MHNIYDKHFFKLLTILPFNNIKVAAQSYFSSSRQERGGGRQS